MIELECPECEGPIEFSIVPDEDWAHNRIAQVDAITRECACELSEDALTKLCAEAAACAEDQDPPGDY